MVTNEPPDTQTYQDHISQTLKSLLLSDAVKAFRPSAIHQAVSVVRRSIVTFHRRRRSEDALWLSVLEVDTHSNHTRLTMIFLNIILLKLKLWKSDISLLPIYDFVQTLNFRLRYQTLLY